MPKGKTPPMTAPGMTDITEARMRLIAREACFYCYGRKVHEHQAKRLSVVSTVRMDRWRKDFASGIFRMDRGAVIVHIKGLDELRWFWPTVDAAVAAYDISRPDQA